MNAAPEGGSNLLLCMTGIGGASEVSPACVGVRSRRVTFGWFG